MSPIKQYREQRKLNQLQMGKLLGVSQTVICKIEAGDMKVPAEKAILWSQIVPGWTPFTLRPDLEIQQASLELAGAH